MNDLIKEITPSELQQISTRITDSRDKSRQLTWSHVIELAEVSDLTKRLFYQQMTILYHWSVRQLRDQEDKMVYECSLIAAKPEDEQEKVLTTGISEKAKSVAMDAMEKAIGGWISTFLPKYIP